MPELPEVEVLVRHLRPRLLGRTVRGVRVRRARVLSGMSLRELSRRLAGATFTNLSRRGKYLVFELRSPNLNEPFAILGHLGMTGRMYLQSTSVRLPKHAAVILNCGSENFVFEDTRYFGRFTADVTVLDRLGPEPLHWQFTSAVLAAALQRSRRAIKVKLLDQRAVAGLGNIYASEALFRAGVSPLIPARKLTEEEIKRLWRGIRHVLREAIARGSTVPLNYAGAGERDGLFYFGSSDSTPLGYFERLRVYDREGHPCMRCGRAIQRVVQAARSTFFCPGCQSRAARSAKQKGGKRRA
jgi:formamidopyrimidine-DNA glycosylase